MWSIELLLTDWLTHLLSVKEVSPRHRAGGRVLRRGAGGAEVHSGAGTCVRLGGWARLLPPFGARLGAGAGAAVHALQTGGGGASLRQPAVQQGRLQASHDGRCRRWNREAGGKVMRGVLPGRTRRAKQEKRRKRDELVVKWVKQLPTLGNFRRQEYAEVVECRSPLTWHPSRWDFPVTHVTAAKQNDPG